VRERARDDEERSGVGTAAEVTEARSVRIEGPALRRYGLRVVRNTVDDAAGIATW
jgi:hypothetical protein